MSYSEEQIEQKRQIALQRKKEALRKNNQPTIVQQSFNDNQPRSSPLPIVNNARDNKTAQTFANKSYSYGRDKYAANKERQGHGVTTGTSKFNKFKERYNPIESQTFFGQKSRISGKCFMISNERFALETSSYFSPLIETLKTIPSKAYEMKTKTWNFHIKDYDTLMEKVVQFKSEVYVNGLPKSVLQVFKKNLNSVNFKDTDLSSMDPKLLESLMPFQRDGICYGISKGGRCMIADDMGLGKTIQALGIAYHFKNNWPLLIVAPSSVRYQWSEAICTFLPSVPTHYVHQILSTKDFVDSNKIVITSYDLLVRVVDSLEKRIFGFVILDESHVLKSIKTSRYKAVQRIVSQARHVVLLSGTPALSRPIELYSQINLIQPNFMGYQEYGVRYCAGEKNSFGWDFSGSSNMTELQLLLRQSCMIRRLKTEVLNQLPSKKREVVMLDPDLIKVGTKEMEEAARQLEKKVLSGVERHSALIHYYNESSIAKQKAICNYITKLFKSKEKCLIFAHHQNILDSICAVAESMNIKYIRIDGKTNPERRKYQVDKFQASDDYLAAVLSITAANAGITLTAAQLVVFAELFWNPGILCQAEDRVHRIGQDENVVIRYLVAKQTADDFLWPLIQRKMNVLNEVGLDQDFSLKDVSVTKQAFSQRQQTLNRFLKTEETQNPQDETLVQSDPSQNTNSSTDEFKELLELNEEDFNFCDWDEMT